MNLRYLETFCVVAELGSLTAAGQRLGITQSAVSLQLQKLEREFGARLVDRSRQPVVLTAAGEALHTEGREILRRYRIAREGVQRSSAEVSGVLRLAASTVPGEYLLPGVLAGFRHLHPNALVELAVVDTAGVYRLLAEGYASFGFTGSRRDDLGLVLEPFAEDEIVLVGPPNMAAGPHKPAALAEWDLLAREAGSGTLATVVERLAESFPAVTVAPVMVLGSTRALLGGVRAGAGVGFVSKLAARCHVEAGDVTEVQIEGLQIPRALWMTYHPGRVSGALREAFLEHVRDWRSRGGPEHHG